MDDCHNLVVINFLFGVLEWEIFRDIKFEVRVATFFLLDV